MKYVTDDNQVFDNEADAKAYEDLFPDVSKYVATLGHTDAAATRLVRQILKWEQYKRGAK